MRRILILLLVLMLTGCAVSPMELPGQEAGMIPQKKSDVIPTTAPALTEQEQEALLLTYMLNALSTRERVGQLFLARCPETDAAAALQQYHLGALVLFGRDFEGQTPQSLRAVLDGYQAAARLPLLIAVDEEGGSVCRVSCYPAFRSSPFRSPRQSYAQGGMDAVLAEEEEKAALLASLGIRVILGPVCDLADTPGAFLYPRSLGQEAAVTGDYIRAAVGIYQHSQVGAVLKHFPGYGNNADTHTGLARDFRSLYELQSSDLLPFQAGIQAGAGAIMVSHAIYSAWDDTLPASLSPEVHRYLREEMAFSGVIVTDDLQMQAISDQYGPGEAAVLAVLAGNDLLCCTDYAAGFEAVLEAVESGRIPREQLDQAVLRVLKWKYDLGILFD